MSDVKFTELLNIRFRSYDKRYSLAARLCCWVIHICGCIPHIIKGCKCKCVLCPRFYGYSRSPKVMKGG